MLLTQFYIKMYILTKYVSMVFVISFLLMYIFKLNTYIVCKKVLYIYKTSHIYVAKNFLRNYIYFLTTVQLVIFKRLNFHSWEVKTISWVHIFVAYLLKSLSYVYTPLDKI